MCIRDRYYIAEALNPEVGLPDNPELGRPEHSEFRWVDLSLIHI